MTIRFCDLLLYVTVSPIPECFRCQAEKRKTINGEDILFAMSTLGFDNYVEPLKLYLQKYREGMKGENKVATVQCNLNLMCATP